MKRVAIGMALVAVMLMVVADLAVAQDARPRSRNRTARRVARPGAQAQYDRLVKAVGQLGLEGETQEKVAKVTAESAEKMEAQKKAEADARSKMAEKWKAARESGDREALTALRQEQRELAAKGREIVKAYEAAVTALLNDGQKAKLAELTQPPIPARALLAAVKANAEELKLTEEQQKALKAVAEKYAAKDGEGDPRRAMWQKMREIRNSDKTNEEKREAQKKLREEMKKAGEASQKRDGECLAAIDKVLNEGQRKQVRTMARKQMQERRTTRRRQGGEGASRRQRRDRDGDGGEGEGRRNRRSKEGAGDSGKKDAPTPDGLLN
jgi:hypothetical protein